MNEKRKIEPALDPDSPDTRTRSDVAPRQKHESGAPVPARHISGLRPAVHLPHVSPAPSVPAPPLTPEDLLEDGWEDEQDSGPTLLDTHGSVPPELVAEARAMHDPIGERDPETREVSTRELPTRSFSQDEAPTGEMPTVSNALRPPPHAEEEDDRKFSHDDFPTRQTPLGLQEALLAYPLPTDSHRGLHETMPAPPEPSEESLPDLPSTPSLGPTIAAPLAPLSPLAMRIGLPAPTPMPMPVSPDETAQMPNRPALSYPPPPADSSSISQISQISQVSHASYPSQSARPLMYPTPTSTTGEPLPVSNTVRFAFLNDLSPNNDPPPSKLIIVAAISFFATLVLSSFIAWIFVLVRH